MHSSVIAFSLDVLFADEEEAFFHRVIVCSNRECPAVGVFVFVSPISFSPLKRYPAGLYFGRYLLNRLLTGE
jgi:hypothetical protein